MKTEREIMEQGGWYRPDSKELIKWREKTHKKCWKLSQTAPDHAGKIHDLLSALFGSEPDHLKLTPPFHCDYGIHIVFGSGCEIGTNCVFLDSARIEVGDRVYIGPGVHLYTVNHPMDVNRRKEGLEQARAIHIGPDVWLGGHVTVLPGVTIGEGSVVAAGSVVHDDVPPHTLVAGVPAVVVRSLDDEKPYDWGKSALKDEEDSSARPESLSSKDTQTDAKTQTGEETQTGKDTQTDAKTQTGDFLGSEQPRWWEEYE